MKIHLLKAEHFSVPGIITKVFTDLAGAEAEAMNLTNLMLADNGQAKSANASNWRAKVEALQDEHGAVRCYVEIAELAVAGAVADPVGAALRRAEAFIAGFEDDESQEGIADLLASIRAAIAGAPLDELQAIRDTVRAYDDKMCDRANDGKDAWPPDGDDYNELFSIVMQGAEPDPVRDAGTDTLAALKRLREVVRDRMRLHGEATPWAKTALAGADAAIAKAEGRS